MDIVSKEGLPLWLLDAVAREALGAATSGVSSGDGHSRIHLLSENPAEQRSASDVLANFGGLRLRPSAPAFVEGADEPVVACQDAAIALDGELAFIVLLDEEEVRRGRGAVVAGEFSLALSGLRAGNYLVFVYRIVGNYASGIARFSVQRA